MGKRLIDYGIMSSSSDEEEDYFNFSDTGKPIDKDFETKQI